MAPKGLAPPKAREQMPKWVQIKSGKNPWVVGGALDRESRDLSLSPPHLDLTMRPLASHSFLWISTPLSLKSGIGDH